MGLKNFKSVLKKSNSSKGNNPKSSSFTDSNGLKWKLVTQENLSSFESEFAELHSWSSDTNIQRFISKRMPIDLVFQSLAPNKDENSQLFFCYDSKTFVGLIYTSTPENEKGDGTIQYIIVNPNLRKKGYGSMMTSSVVHNTNKFFKHKFSNNINASVEEENKASRHTFESNGFKNIGSNTSSGRKYKIYRLNPRESEMDR